MNCFVGFVQAVYLRTVIAAAISVARASEDFHRGRLESERAKREAERWRREASMTKPIESKNYERERDEVCEAAEQKIFNWHPSASALAFRLGADWGAAYERRRAEKLVEALEIITKLRGDSDKVVCINVIGYASEKAREALAAYENSTGSRV